MQIEEQQYFSWKCLVCGQIALSPLHVEMQWLVNYGPHLDIDGSTKWVKCGKCFSIPCDMFAESIQNPYWPLCLYFFRLQAVIFLISNLSIYLFIFIFVLFSFTLTMVKEQKRKWLPKGLAKARMVGTSHHNQDINKWKEPIMKVCLDEYYEELAAENNIAELVNHAAIAKKYGISPSTLHHRVSKLKSSHQVRGWRHASSGKRQP